MKRFFLPLCFIFSALFCVNARGESGFERNVMIDELTGTWCKWCIYGIVNIDRAMEEYGDRFIPVVVHGGTDVMKDPDYCTAVEKLGGFISYPNAIINRDKSMKGAPKEELLSKLPSLLEEKAPAKLAMSTEFSEDMKEACVTTQILFSPEAEASGWRMSYVIVEDSVHQPGNSDYIQQNGYAGGGSGEMGGFENLPANISSVQMFYRYVCRGSVGGFNGIEGSLPDEIDGGSSYTHELTFPIPESVLVPSNCYLVALLLDKDFHVAQALRVRIGDTSASFGDGEAGLTMPLDREDGAARFFGIDGMERRSMLPGLNIVVFPDGTSKKIYIN